MRDKLGREDNKKGNEHYVDTLSTNKLCTENVNGKNEYACPTSIEVRITLDENAHILPLPMERTTKDYGNVYIIWKKVSWL